MQRREILWHCAALASAEHAFLEATDRGWRLGGVTVIPVDDVPGHIEYTVTTDRDWVTTGATVAVSGGRSAAFVIEASGGSWSVNGVERPDLAGCVDVDLGWTPATNILPIRRMGLPVGDTATTSAAWLRFPELVIDANAQRYTRTAVRTWRYESGPYDFHLVVDEVGRVVEYGDDLWRAVAAT
jgi:hypothetical protein